MLADVLQVLPFEEVLAALRDTYDVAVEALKRAQPGSWKAWYVREVCTHVLGTQPVCLRRRLP
jgi:hypothetical protein